MLMTSCRATFGNWKQRNLGKTLKVRRLRKKIKSNSALRALIEAFSNLRRSVIMVPPGYLAAMSWIKFPKDRDIKHTLGGVCQPGG